jgi:hypothetical protein
MRVTNQPGAAVEARFTGTEVRWRASRYDDAGQARVSIDGKEVEVVDLYSPGRDIPVVWERKGLSPGDHTIRIEALGRKQEASKGIWINVVAIEPGWQPSEIGAAAFDSAKVLPDKEGFALLQIRNRKGEEVRLRDFGSAGAGRTPYMTWLPIRGVKAAPFSRTNPSRTSRRKS